MDIAGYTLALASLCAALLVAASNGEVVVDAAHAEPAQVAMPQPENPHAVEDRVLIDYLSRRYRTGRDSMRSVVDLARDAGREAGLDPLLILAVIGVESSFNPVAESVAGAKGLMQIIPKWHGDKLAVVGGEQAVWEPEPNILVGTRILREYIARWGGVEPGLLRYNGSSWDETAEYSRKVFAEHARLRAALAEI